MVPCLRDESADCWKTEPGFFTVHFIGSRVHKLAAVWNMSIQRGFTDRFQAASFIERKRTGSVELSILSSAVRKENRAKGDRIELGWYCKWLEIGACVRIFRVLMKWFRRWEIFLYLAQGFRCPYSNLESPVSQHRYLSHQQKLKCRFDIFFNQSTHCNTESKSTT